MIVRIPTWVAMSRDVGVPSPKSAAIVQDWFFMPGGSERCAVEFARILPEATVHTSFFDPAYGVDIDPSRIRPWPLQRLTGPTAHYRSLLPLYPLWFSSLDLRRHDLVLTGSTAFAYAVRTSARTLHVSYVQGVMRYAWDIDRYLDGSSVGRLGKIGARALGPWLRRWDRKMSRRPDVVVANSTAVRDRIAHLWDRDAQVIHPPVETGEIGLSDTDDGFLLVVSRMLAYRRLDLAIKAANALRRDLVVVGTGPEEARLRSLAGPTVRFVGVLGRLELIDLFRRCHAYIVPGEEDFGIAPVEAMAAGKPVIAFRAGGALDTVVEGRVGLFFEHQTPSDVAAAIEAADAHAWNGTDIRNWALTFDATEFRRSWRALLLDAGVDAGLLAPTDSAASG